jgi:hypothetical protein
MSRISSAIKDPEILALVQVNNTYVIHSQDATKTFVDLGLWKELIKHHQKDSSKIE